MRGDEFWFVRWERDSLPTYSRIADEKYIGGQLDKWYKYLQPPEASSSFPRSYTGWMHQKMSFDISCAWCESGCWILSVRTIGKLGRCLVSLFYIYELCTTNWWLTQRAFRLRATATNTTRNNSEIDSRFLESFRWAVLGGRGWASTILLPSAEMSVGRDVVWVFANPCFVGCSLIGDIVENAGRHDWRQIYIHRCHIYTGAQFVDTTQY